MPIKDSIQIAIPFKHQKDNGRKQHFHRLRITLGLTAQPSQKMSKQTVIAFNGKSVGF